MEGYGSVNIGAEETVTVPEGNTLTVDDGGTQINSGALINNGTIYFSVYNTTNSGQIENHAILYVTSDFSNQGTIISSGSITISGQYVALSNSESGILTVESGGSMTVSANTRLSTAAP